MFFKFANHLSMIIIRKENWRGIESDHFIGVNNKFHTFSSTGFFGYPSLFVMQMLSKT